MTKNMDFDDKMEEEISEKISIIEKELDHDNYLKVKDIIIIVTIGSLSIIGIIWGLV